MIRFTIICLTTLGVLGALFMLLVYRAQPNAAVSTTSTTVLPIATPIATTRSADGLGPGSKPWIINYDEQGKIVSKFTADEFTPQKDGSYDVDHPIAVFYLDKGQVMRVTGDSGKVDCGTATPGASKSILSGPANSPHTGLLQHVHLALFPSADSIKPTQWMDADNIHFDNDQLRMWTEMITDPVTKKVITESDQVPVTIRGDEYEFDGKGLTLIWNGVSRRLEELQIVHGEKLVIKDPSKLSLPGMTAPEPAKQTVTFVPSDVHGETLGSAQSVNTGVSLLPTFDSRTRPPVQLAFVQTPKPAVAPQPPTPYRAVFHENVKITDGAKTMAIADLMTVDFLQSSNSNSNSSTSSNSNSSTNNGGANSSPRPIAAAPAIIAPPAGVVASAPPAAAPAHTSSSTLTPPPSVAKPSGGPITIYWTGTLMVTPLHGEPMLPLAAGQSIVKLQGKKVVLSPEGLTVECAAATYRSPDGAARLESSSDLPRIHLTQVKGLDLLTEQMDYEPAISRATLTGRSELQVPMGNKTMDVKWSKIGVLHVIRLPGLPNGVDQVDLADDVDVEHPQFSLTSASLQLQLDLLPRATGPATDTDEQLKLLTANGDRVHRVHCRLKQPGKPDQEGIDSDTLVIHTERSFEGATAPREVDATGNVHAFDPDQWIDSEYLKAMLWVPLKGNATTKPSGDDDVASGVELESLYAQTKVKAHLKSGATADTNELTVSGPEGFRTVLLNDSEHGTTLTDGKKSSVYSTSTVEITPDQGGVKIEGAGMMKTVRSTTQPVTQTIPTTPAPTVPSVPQPQPQPMEVSWRDRMVLESAANVADFYGKVQVINYEADGAKDTITGDTCHIDLVDTVKNDLGKNDLGKNDLGKNDLATNGAAKKPATELKKPTTQSDDMRSAMWGKELKQLTLSGHVIGVTELVGPDGALLRQGLLQGEKLIYTAADQTAVIPGAGKMFVENHKPDAVPAGNNQAGNNQAGTNQAGTNQAGTNQPGNNPGGNNRGQTAIEWKKQLTFNQLTQLITITGDTAVAFQQEPPPAKAGKPVKPQPPMHLYAQKLVITLSKTEPAPGQTEAKSQAKSQAKAQAKAQGKTQVSKMDAYDQVRFIAPTVDLTCSTVDYDPLQALLTAKGSDRQPGEMTNAAQTTTGSFDEVTYDTIKEEVLHVKDFKAQMKP